MAERRLSAPSHRKPGKEPMHTAHRGSAAENPPTGVHPSWSEERAKEWEPPSHSHKSKDEGVSESGMQLRIRLKSTVNGWRCVTAAAADSRKNHGQESGRSVDAGELVECYRSGEATVGDEEMTDSGAPKAPLRVRIPHIDGTHTLRGMTAVETSDTSDVLNYVQRQAGTGVLRQLLLLNTPLHSTPGKTEWRNEARMECVGQGIERCE
ncbi:hypothetical protein FB451DRAFT_1191662 [Mycena latifolia]|nr:hypothetical protein FB451DRAFT_1191662 [Mycena latifolia]